METLLFRLVKSESSHASLPIYKVFESTERVAVTKEDLIKAIRKVAGGTSLWSRLWSDRLRKNNLNKEKVKCVVLHTHNILVARTGSAFFGRKKNHHHWFYLLVRLVRLLLLTLYLFNFVYAQTRLMQMQAHQLPTK